jgi:hypothetical protein
MALPRPCGGSGILGSVTVSEACMATFSPFARLGGPH